MKKYVCDKCGKEIYDTQLSRLVEIHSIDGVKKVYSSNYMDLCDNCFLELANKRRELCIKHKGSENGIYL